MIKFDTIDGTVISSAVWSETHISGSSSGGRVDQYGISAPTLNVSSSVSDKKQIFVKADDGQEIEITSSYWTVGFRPDSKIRLVCAKNEVIALKNIDTENWERFSDKLLVMRFKPHKLFPRSLFSRLLTFLFWLIAALLSVSIIYVAPIFAGFDYKQSIPSQHKEQLVAFVDKYYIADPIAHSSLLYWLIIGLFVMLFLRRKRKQKGLKLLIGEIEERFEPGSEKPKGPVTTGGRKA